MKLAYIYKITNDINGKIYIGKTEHSIDKRFKEHCHDRLNRKYEKRPLYAAMNKYGIEHFHVELLEETCHPEEREVYWIEYFDSYRRGYNATRGGDGKAYLNHQLIIDTYLRLQNIKDTAKTLQISVSAVKCVIHSNHIVVKPSSEILLKKYGKPVMQFTKNEKYIRTFPSAKSAVIALGKLPSENNRGAISHITSACKGKRQTAYGYKWKFANT